MDEQNLLIDKILSYVVKSYPKLPTYNDIIQNVYVDGNINNYNRAVDTMEKLMLIGHHESEKERYVILRNGYEALLEGGWIEYNRKKQEYRQLQVDNIKASITTNKNVKVNIWITLSVAALACYFQYDKDSNQKLRDEVKDLKNRQELLMMQVKLHPDSLQNTECEIHKQAKSTLQMQNIQNKFIP